MRSLFFLITYINCVLPEHTRQKTALQSFLFGKRKIQTEDKYLFTEHVKYFLTCLNMRSIIKLYYNFLSMICRFEIYIWEPKEDTNAFIKIRQLQSRLCSSYLKGISQKIVYIPFFAQKAEQKMLHSCSNLFY